MRGKSLPRNVDCNSENIAGPLAERVSLGSDSEEMQTDNSCYTKTASVNNRVKRREWINEENRIMASSYLEPKRKGCRK